MLRRIGHMDADCPRARWFLEKLIGPLNLDLGYVGENRHLLHDLLVKAVAEAHGAGGRVIGADIDTQAVREAALPHTLAADARRLPFADGAFDTVTAGELIEHIAPCDDLFSEAFRLLRPGGGRFLLSTPSAFDALKWLRWWIAPRSPRQAGNVRGWLGHAEHRHVWAPPSLMGRLMDAGFEISDCQTRRFRVPLLQRMAGEQVVWTHPFWPFTRMSEFVCIEARKP